MESGLGKVGWQESLILKRDLSFPEDEALVKYVEPWIEEQEGKLFLISYVTVYKMLRARDDLPDVRNLMPYLFSFLTLPFLLDWS